VRIAARPGYYPARRIAIEVAAGLRPVGLRELLAIHGVNLADDAIDGVHLRFQFDGCGRQKYRTVCLLNPNSTNLRDTGRDRLIRRYLREWSFDAESSRSTANTVGSALSLLKHAEDPLLGVRRAEELGLDLQALIESGPLRRVKEPNDYVPKGCERGGCLLNFDWDRRRAKGQVGARTARRARAASGRSLARRFAPPRSEHADRGRAAGAARTAPRAPTVAMALLGSRHPSNVLSPHPAHIFRQVEVHADAQGRERVRDLHRQISFGGASAGRNPSRLLVCRIRRTVVARVLP
jgi:hypothetical protein